MSKFMWNCLLAIPAFLSAELILSWSASATEVTKRTEEIQPRFMEISVIAPTGISEITRPQLGQLVAPPETQLEQIPLVTNKANFDQFKAREQGSREVLVQVETDYDAHQNQNDELLAQALPVASDNIADATEVLEQINRYSNNGNNNSLNQITNVSQLRDVSPGDWAYEALRSLVERYGCIVGYPDGTYRGQNALTRFEFAAGLNACLNQIEGLLAGTTTQVSREDFETIQRLTGEFQTELTTLGARVDNLEGRVSSLEDNQFSTTTKLKGEVIFGLSDSFGGENLIEDNAVFQHRTRLNFDTSFTGRDRLRVRFQARNAPVLTTPGSVGNEGALAWSGGGDNSFVIHDLSYRFAVNDKLRLALYGNAALFNSFVNTLNPLDSVGQGSISRFGVRNPVYRIGASIRNAGAAVSFDPSSTLRLDLGYVASAAADPSEDAGLFNGSYAAIAQATFRPNKDIALAATYVHAYNTSSTGDGGRLGHNTGSLASQVQTNRPVVSDSYGIEASFNLSPQVILSGWVGYTDATVIGRGEADVWNYAATLAIKDLGREGSTLGFVVGMQPRLTGTSNATVASLINGLGAGSRKDPDVGLHIEGFYKFALTDNISITPGIIWLTAPGHNENNDDVFIGTIRTTFTF
ncbi:MAG: iron uptake porin [Symploca sp. SIO2E9]|nr:iron uptake porin [Symploca sp. SIO2E9]